MVVIVFLPLISKALPLKVIELTVTGVGAGVGVGVGLSVGVDVGLGVEVGEALGVLVNFFPLARAASKSA